MSNLFSNIYFVKSAVSFLRSICGELRATLAKVKRDKTLNYFHSLRESKVWWLVNIIEFNLELTVVSLV